MVMVMVMVVFVLLLHLGTGFVPRVDVYPLEEGPDPGVDPGLVFEGTPVTPADYADDEGLPLLAVAQPKVQRTTRITLASVIA
jgi:hypothetical protein